MGVCEHIWRVECGLRVFCNSLFVNTRKVWDDSVHLNFLSEKSEKSRFLY